MFPTLIMVIVSQGCVCVCVCVCVCIYIYKLTKLYTLNICSLLYTIILQGFPSGSGNSLASAADMCSIQVQKDSI